MSVEILSTGNVRLAFLNASLLERAGIRTKLVLADDELFGGELYCIHVDTSQVPAGRALLESLDGAAQTVDDDGVLTYDA